MRLRNQLIELAAGHLQFLGMRIDPVRKCRILLCCPSALKFRPIAALPIEFEIKRVLQFRELSRAYGFGGENRRNKNYPISLRQHEIAWKHRRTTDTNRRINRR